MSQNPNEQGHFTNLFNLNPSYQQETGSNPSTPSSQHSISSSSIQQYSGFGTQYGTPLPSPEQIFRQQQQTFFNHQLNNQFQNFHQQKSTPFQILQKQPEAFQQSKPQPQPSKDNRRGKRVAKRATVDLVDEKKIIFVSVCQCARWTRDEEILLTQCWIETSKNGLIGADRTEDSFWGQIMDDFNSATTQGYRTRHMLTSKWTRINGDCQKFNAIYKHIERKSGENEADHIEAAKITFAAHQSKGRKRKLQAGTSAYEAKKQKELAMMEFKEIEFLTIDADKLPEPKASIIRKRQEKIIAKYAQE
ncbi:hypothetical protein Tco_1115221 [Tanacetum coccineum]